MTNGTQKVSIIIPVYNEERYIRSCLKSIRKQSVKPYEIIVVDNNCTDRTVKIAGRFRKIKIIKESQQGLGHARNKGFNRAKGDLLLRIDADTYLPKQYIKNLLILYNNNPQVAGFSGYGVSRFESLPKTSKLWGWCYFTYTRAFFGYPIMWGANMSLKKYYWNESKKYLVGNNELVHEDQDLSLALASVGGRAKIVKDLEVSVNMEGIQHFGKYRHYLWMMRNLKKLDKQNKRASLKRRLKKDNVFLRLLMWLASAWSVYAFYLVTIGYSAYWRFTLFMKTH